MVEFDCRRRAAGVVLMCMRAARLLLTIFIYLLLCAAHAIFFSVRTDEAPTVQNAPNYRHYEPLLSGEGPLLFGPLSV